MKKCLFCENESMENEDLCKECLNVLNGKERVNIIEQLINKTIINIVKNDYEIIFECNNGEKYKMYHEEECCEDVKVEDISGDLEDLLNTPLLMAEEATEEGETDWGTCTWTFYKFATINGYVTIRWYGESNGYYSESVDIEKVN